VSLDRRRLLERAHIVEQEMLKRRADDPMRDWEPSPRQKPFVEAVLERGVRSAWFLAANRSGKSDAGAYVGAHLARYGPREADVKSSFAGSGKDFMEVRDRATSGWVVSLDFPNSRDVIQPKYFDNGFVGPGQHPPFIPKREIAEWRVTDQVLKLTNGSLIGFKSADSPVAKFQGSGKDWIHFDEEPPYNHYEEAIIRVEAGRSLTVFATCTLLPPLGQVGGVSWIFPEIVKPWQAGELKNVEVFTSSIYDNPHIGPDEIRMLESIFPAGSRAREIRLEGKLLPGLGGTRAYAAFNRDLHVKPLGEWNPHLPIAWCWDFNVEPLITHICQRQDVFRVFQQLMIEDSGSIPEMCEMFRNAIDGHRGEVYVYGDATGQNRSAQYSQTDYTIIQNQMLQYNIPVKLRIPRVNPLVSDRLGATNRALKDENGAINLEIDPSCIELIDDYEQVLMDPRGGIKKATNRKDPYYRRTHSSDGIGYWIAYEAPVRHLTRRGRIGATVRQIAYSFSR